MSDVTRILSAIDQGDPHAAEQLLPLVYDELRKLAAQKLAGETGPDAAGHGFGPRGLHPARGRGKGAALEQPPRAKGRIPFISFHTFVSAVKGIFFVIRPWPGETYRLS